MPIREMPKFKSVPDKMFEIPQPGVGGLNLFDLEFEQEASQSPYMKNMMYRNGAFSKRYGQGFMQGTNGDISINDIIYSMVVFDECIFCRAGDGIYRIYDGVVTKTTNNLPQYPDISIGNEGMFLVYGQKLYFKLPYSVSTYKEAGIYEYNNGSWSLMDYYVPEVLINCKPDGTNQDPVDDFNLLSNQFTIVYNGETGVATYEVAPYDPNNVIDWSVTPIVKVDDEAVAFTANVNKKQIIFNSAPDEGDMNVTMTFTMKPNALKAEKESVLSCRYYETFGGANNSRLFLAGDGKSRYYWSDAYDISYFPENNFATLGNTEDDISGFGRQYNVLIVFKPREIYSINSYIENASTTVIEEDLGKEAFKSQLVNARIGCDAPKSIQLINNLLTWFNTKQGVCTLVSTNVLDERNVRQISRNIEHTNKFGLPGILEQYEWPISADYDDKYFLCFPNAGICYVWDYEISPYHYSSSGETNPKTLTWFYFDNIYAGQFLNYEKKLIYCIPFPPNGGVVADGKIVEFNDSFFDLDFNNDGSPDIIHSFYQTPFLQFGAVEYLKNVKNLYVQCRGDVSSTVDIYYYTDESNIPEKDPESIETGARLWKTFSWGDFVWVTVNFAKTFRRKCNLKKIQMVAFYFENNEYGRDMSLTHLGMQYQLVKYVR